MFRDVVLLLVNIGMLVLLFIIAGQMSGQRQRTRTVPKQVTDLLEKILASQRKAASALVTTNNEFRNQLKNMVLNVESSTVTSAETPGAAPPLGDFKALRREFGRIEEQFAGTIDGLRKLTEQTTQSVSELSSALRGERQHNRKLITEFQSALRADLGAQADRLRKTVSEISLPAAPVAASTPGRTNPQPVLDIDGPLAKWFNRTQDLHNHLIKEVRRIGSKLTIPTEQLTKAADTNVAQLCGILESFMIENVRHDKQTEEFHRSLREDFQAQANLFGKVVAEMPARGHSPTTATAPVPAPTTALDQSLKQWLGRTQELHESMLKKIQSSGSGRSGNGNGGSSEFAVRDLRQSIDQHQESLRKLLQDFMTENIRHHRSAEEFRSEMREDFRNQTGLLSQAVSGITRKLAESPAGDSTAPAPDLAGPFDQWLGRTEELHRSLLAEIRSATGQIQFPTDEFRQITDQHHESLRKLLEDWTDESIRRVHATDELRAAIQQDIKTQADRLKQLADAAPGPAATTAGTITASASDEPNQQWRESVATELRTIIDKLDRMHVRMDEIFQI